MQCIVCPPTPTTFCGGGGDVKFEGGVGHDDGADVAADHDDLAAQPKLSLAAYQFGSHFFVAGDEGDVGVYVWGAEFPGCVLPVEDGGVLTAVSFPSRRFNIYLDGVGEVGDGRFILHSYSFFKRGQSYCPIHTARIEE